MKMTPEMWQRVCAALDRVDGMTEEARGAHLEQLRRDDPEVAREVEVLLRQQQQSGGKLSLRTMTQALRDELRKHQGGVETGLLSAPGSQGQAGEGSEPASVPGQSGTYADLEPGKPPSEAGASDSDLSAVLGHEILEEFRRLGSFRVKRVLGRGGMGMVLEGEDLKLGRAVAIKVMLPHLGASEQARQRFLREARAAAIVEHERVVPIYQVGEAGDVPFVVMPLLRGESLGDRLQRERVLPVAEAVRLGRQVAEGLAAAHRHGLIHRDIKPANVWLESTGSQEPGGGQPPRVKILDFGLARATSAEEAQLTATGMVVGTPSYMSPEQAQAQELDARADLFSLGCVLYRMCTGRSPFTGNSATAIILAVVQSEPERVDRINPEVPWELADLIHRLLSKDRAGRPDSASGVAEQLRRLEEERDRTTVVAAEPVAANVPAVPPARSSRRRPLLIAGGVLVLLTLAAAAAVIFGPALRVGTARGTLVIESDAPDIEVVVRKDGAVVVEPTGEREIELEVGDYTIKLAEKGGGLRLSTQSFTIEDGGRTVVRVTPVPPPPPGRSPFDLYDRAKIDPYELKAVGDGDASKVPKELVAVLGESRFRSWGTDISGVAFSPDGTRVATVARLGDVSTHVWDVKTGRQLLSLPSGPSDRAAVAYSQDGQTLATATEAGRVFLWDAANGNKLREWKADGVCEIAFSPDGLRVVTGGPGGVVQVWDVRTGMEVHHLQGHAKQISNVAYSADGKWLASGSDDHTVKVWDAAAGKEVHTLRHRGVVSGVAFSAEGMLVASVAHDGDLKLWDVITGEAGQTFSDAGRGNNAVACGPKGTSLVAYRSGGASVIVRDVTSGRVVYRSSPKSGTSALAFSPDGNRLANGGEFLEIFDLATGKELTQPRGAPASITSLAIRPDGKVLASCDYGEKILRLWEAGSSQENAAVNVPAADIAFSPNGNLLACTSSSRVTVLDARGRKEVWRGTRASGYWPTLAFSPDSTLFAIGSTNKLVHLFDATSGKELHTLAGHLMDVDGVAFSPSGGHLVSADHNGTFKVWDSKSGKELHGWQLEAGSPSLMHAITFSPDGKHLAIGRRPSPVLLDPNTGNVVQTIRDRLDQMQCVTYSPDGKLLAASDIRGQVSIWDVATGKALRHWRFGGRIWQVAFAPDGRHLVTANGNSTMYVLRLDDLLAEAQARSQD